MCAGCGARAIERLSESRQRTPFNVFDKRALRVRLPDPRVRAEVEHDLKRYGRLTERVQAIVDNPPPIPGRDYYVTSAGVTAHAINVLRADQQLEITNEPPLFDDNLGEVLVWKIHFKIEDDANFMDRYLLVHGVITNNAPRAAKQERQRKEERRKIYRSVVRT